jgi:NADH-quinone oxidoreductase subunit J
MLLTILLSLLVGFGFYAVLSKTLLKAAIGLGAVSAALTILLFTMNSPLAAVFELSVCAGLITVIFVSVISMTKAAAPKDQKEAEPNHYVKYLPMIAIGAIVFWAMRYYLGNAPVAMAAVSTGGDVRHALWDLRAMDIFGQLAVLLAGISGVIVLFKELKHDE